VNYIARIKVVSDDRSRRVDAKGDWDLDFHRADSVIRIPFFVR